MIAHCLSTGIDLMFCLRQLNCVGSYSLRRATFARSGICQVLRLNSSGFSAPRKRHFTRHHQYDDPPRYPSTSTSMASGTGEYKEGLRIAVQGCVRNPY